MDATRLALIFRNIIPFTDLEKKHSATALPYHTMARGSEATFLRVYYILCFQRSKLAVIHSMFSVLSFNDFMLDCRLSMILSIVVIESS
jgi:hypothetical protein